MFPESAAARAYADQQGSVDTPGDSTASAAPSATSSAAPAATDSAPLSSSTSRGTLPAAAAPPPPLREHPPAPAAPCDGPHPPPPLTPPRAPSAAGATELHFTAAASSREGTARVAQESAAAAFASGTQVHLDIIQSNCTHSLLYLQHNTYAHMLLLRFLLSVPDRTLSQDVMISRSVDEAWSSTFVV